MTGCDRGYGVIARHNACLAADECEGLVGKVNVLRVVPLVGQKHEHGGAEIVGRLGVLFSLPSLSDLCDRMFRRQLVGADLAVLFDPRLDVAAAVVHPSHHFDESRSVSLVPQRRPRLKVRSWKDRGHCSGGDQLILAEIAQLLYRLPSVVLQLHRLELVGLC